MADRKPRRQNGEHIAPPGFTTLSGICRMLGIDLWAAKDLYRQGRLPQPITLSSPGGRVYHFFSIDGVRGKLGAQTSLTKQKPLKLPRNRIAHTLDRVRRIAKDQSASRS